MIKNRLNNLALPRKQERRETFQKWFYGDCACCHDWNHGWSWMWICGFWPRCAVCKQTWVLQFPLLGLNVMCKRGDGKCLCTESRQEWLINTASVPWVQQSTLKHLTSRTRFLDPISWSAWLPHPVYAGGQGWEGLLSCSFGVGEGAVGTGPRALTPWDFLRSHCLLGASAARGVMGELSKWDGNKGLRGSQL